MSRLIDADLLEKEFIKDTPQGCEAVGIKYIDDLIKKQPTANEWILCSERLPESNKSRSYLVTKTCIDENSVISEVCTEIFWIGDNKWDCERDCYSEWEIIAWQPLPDPYTENGKES
jgi:hypothetical protein